MRPWCWIECDHCGNVRALGLPGDTPAQIADQHEQDNAGHAVWSAYPGGVVSPDDIGPDGSWVLQ